MTLFVASTYGSGMTARSSNSWQKPKNVMTPTRCSQTTRSRKQEFAGSLAAAEEPIFESGLDFQHSLQEVSPVSARVQGFCIR